MSKAGTIRQELNEISATLSLLGIALTDKYNHKWSALERDSYDKSFKTIEKMLNYFY